MQAEPKEEKKEAEKEGIKTRFCRFLVKPIVEVLAKANVTPNQVTAFRLLVMVPAFTIPLCMGGYYYSLLGVLLFQLTYVIDHIDGGIAKLTGRFSKYGGLVDGRIDTIARYFLIFGVSYGLYAQSHDAIIWVTGMLSLIGATASNEIRIRLKFDKGLDWKDALKKYYGPLMPVENLLSLIPLFLVFALIDQLFLVLVITAVRYCFRSLWLMLVLLRE